MPSKPRKVWQESTRISKDRVSPSPTALTIIKYPRSSSHKVSVNHEKEFLTITCASGKQYPTSCPWSMEHGSVFVRSSVLPLSSIVSSSNI